MNKKQQLFSLAKSCVKDGLGWIISLSAVLTFILLLCAFPSVFSSVFLFLFNMITIPFVLLGFFFLLSSALLRCMLIKDEKEQTKLFNTSNAQLINNYLAFSVIYSSIYPFLVILTVFILNGFNVYNFILSWFLFIPTSILFFKIPKKEINSIKSFGIMDVLYKLSFILFAIFSFLNLLSIADPIISY